MFSGIFAITAIAVAQSLGALINIRFWRLNWRTLQR